jgi:hypothetical protein
MILSKQPSFMIIKHVHLLHSGAAGLYTRGTSHCVLLRRATQWCGRLIYSWYFALCTATALELSAVPAARRR